MSSSDEVIGWSAFRERALSVPVEHMLSPASELEAALQSCWQWVDAERAAASDAIADAVDIIARQALPIFRLSVALSRNETVLAGPGLNRVHRQLRVLRDQMLEVLESCDLLIVDPAGRPLGDVADAVDVIGWRHGPEFDDKVVAETIEPIVMRGTEVIRRGRVIMGAPTADSGKS
jgi:hypothetical protein